MDIDLPEDQFITEDEILSVLGRGSQISYGKERLYNYLTEEHSIKEKIEFLKTNMGQEDVGRQLSEAGFHLKTMMQKELLLKRNLVEKSY